jgi:hypothetical protein
LRPAEWRQHSPSEGVGSLVELAALGEAALGQDCAPDPAVVWVDANGYQPLFFEQPQETADVSGIEAEASSKISDVSAVQADLPQQARFAERTRAAKKMILERANSLGNGSIEATDLLDRRVCHDL